MVVELSRSTNYYPRHHGLSLAVPGNRRDMGPVDHKTFETAVEIAGSLGLTDIRGDINRGDNKTLKVSGGTVDLSGYGRKESQYRRLGFAVEYSPRDPEGKGDPLPRAIFVREAYAFNEEAFAYGVQALLKYDDRTILPRCARGYWIYGIGAAAGVVAGMAAVGGIEYFTASHIDTFAKAGITGTGAVAGYFGGDYKYKYDNWELNRKVTGLDQYFANDEAEKTLVKIASHLETVKTLTKIESVLRERDVDVSAERIATIWRSDTHIGQLIKHYNDGVYGEGSNDQDRIKTELIVEMASRVREVARST